MMNAHQSSTEPYIRSLDNATMVAISPGVYVNEAVWNKIGKTAARDAQIAVVLKKRKAA
jgi:hypothetical protein